jgi:hypothetical protein
VDLREALAVTGAVARIGQTSALARWSGSPAAGLRGPVAVLHGVCGAATTVLLVLGVMGRVPAGPVAAWLVIQLAVAGYWRRRVDEVIERIGRASDDLALFRGVLSVVEGVAFTSPKLAALRARLMAGGAPPSRLIARLQTFTAVLDQAEHNPYARMLAVPTLVRAQMAVGVDVWHARHARALADWIAVIGELEALASLATYAFERPDDPFPSLVPGGPTFDAQGLSHPLLSVPGTANDVHLGGSAPSLLIVSGSNMSGKSTLLRAVGVNAVMALAGAPVRAARLVLSPLAIGATIRVEDSLQAGQSRFYAEVLRIRAIVDLASRQTHVLFLLDEILHGTNSHDRRIGAEAIVRTLVGAGAIGLVTTHDLALTELAASFDGRAANVHFEDRIEDGRMVFDYRMRPGVVEHSNALALMRAVGLDV